jgi:hypothetical protein
MTARFALLYVALGLVGCGHPATETECNEIIERVARLELEKQRPGDEKFVQEEIDTAKESLRQSSLKQCVGKRITDKAMRCVRQAKTSKEIVDDCFD